MIYLHENGGTKVYEKMRLFQHEEVQTEMQSPINKQEVKDMGKTGRNREAQHEARGKIRT